MTRSSTAIFTLLIMSSTSAGIAQSADPIEELKACARMEDPHARFACLDYLGQRVLGEESAHQEPVQEEVTQPEAETTATAPDAQPEAEATATAPDAQPEAETTATVPDAQPLPDDLGVTESKTVNYSGMITSCRQGHYGNWYFTFDNGQVWKEVTRRNRRFKDCSFNVTITKDGFGYKMHIDSLDTTFRVRRHK